MQAFLSRYLPTTLLALATLLTGVGCVYDPYYYDGYYRPNAYMIEPGMDNGEPPYRYRNRPNRNPGPRYREDQEYDRPARRYGDRRYYEEERGYAGPRRGRTEYLEDDEDPGMDDGHDRREAPADRAPAMADRESQPPPSLKDNVPGGQKSGGTPPLDTKEIKTATKAKTPGRVKSPYPPYPELDVSGLNPGSLAKDPNTGKVFRIP